MSEKNNQQKSNINQKTGKTKKKNNKMDKKQTTKKITETPRKPIEATKDKPIKLNETKPSTADVIARINAASKKLEDFLRKDEKSLVNEKPDRFSTICSILDKETIEALEIFGEYEGAKDEGIQEAVTELEETIDEVKRWRTKTEHQLAANLKKIKNACELLKNEGDKEQMEQNKKQALEVLGEVTKFKIVNSDTASGSVLLQKAIDAYAEKITNGENEEKKWFKLANLYSTKGITSPASRRAAVKTKEMLGFTEEGKRKKKIVEQKIQIYDQTQALREKSKNKSFFD